MKSISQVDGEFDSIEEEQVAAEPTSPGLGLLVVVATGVLFWGGVAMMFA